MSACCRVNIFSVHPSNTKRKLTVSLYLPRGISHLPILIMHDEEFLRRRNPGYLHQFARFIWWTLRYQSKKISVLCLVKKCSGREGYSLIFFLTEQYLPYGSLKMIKVKHGWMRKCDALSKCPSLQHSSRLINIISSVCPKSRPAGFLLLIKQTYVLKAKAPSSFSIAHCFFLCLLQHFNSPWWSPFSFTLLLLYLFRFFFWRCKFNL